MKSEDVKIVGIVNLTPDSFSDGGVAFNPTEAVKRAYSLKEAGADLIELGADSTRPGSQCVGVEEEWLRLEPVLEQLGGRLPLSLDTHHAGIVEKARSYAIDMVNDVSGASNPDMLENVRESGVLYVIMHSACPRVHEFNEGIVEDPVTKILNFFEQRIAQALKAGILRSQIILDPGLGAFVSQSSKVSWDILDNLAAIEKLGFPLMIGASRKGFLKLDCDDNNANRDALSLLAVHKATEHLSSTVYVRVHNVAIHSYWNARLR